MGSSELQALMALSVQGVATRERLLEDLSPVVAGLASRDLAVERTIGRVSGWSLTAEGRTALDESLAAEGLRGHERLTGLYERFLVLNERLLRIASDWQVRRDGPVEEPNDHTDPSYDATVIDRLGELHDRTRTLLTRVAGVAPRYAPYVHRLEACLARCREGDRSALTSALAESYHTVWFELHQDLILTLGVEREA